MPRPMAWLPRRLAGVAALTLILVAGWLPGTAPPAAAGPPLNNPTWAASRSNVSATGVSYTYTFKNAGPNTTIDSITMTVPAGTGGTPAVGSVSPPTVAAGGAVTLSGTTLTYSFTPSPIKNGKPVSIQVIGLTNTATAGSYTSAMATMSSGTTVASGTTPALTFTTGALASPGWSASSTATGAAAVSYTYTFTTGSTAAISSVIISVPASTAGTPAVGTVTPAALAAGGTVSLSGTTLTYSFTLATVSAATPVSIQVTGLTNTPAAGTYTSDLTTQSDTGIVDAGTTPGVTLTGILTLTSPGSLTWAATLNGLNQSVADAVAADQQLTVADSTGSGAGWHVTASATTLASGPHALPNAGTLSFTGSTGSAAGSTAPTAACAPSTACILPAGTTTYPVAITTAASAPTAFTVYGTSAATGLGQIVLGGSTAANPIGWWVKIPANAYAGSYTTTVTLAVVSAP